MQKNNIPTQRQLRVSTLIRNVLSDAVSKNDLYSEDGKNLSVTISEVSLSPDLRNAHIFIMPLGGNDIEETIKILQGKAWYYKKVIAGQLNLRYTPKLTFIADTSFEQANKVDQILQRPDVQKDIKSPSA